MKRAGSFVATLKLSADTDNPEARARAAWEPAAGKKIARHTLAAALVRNTLVVEVEDLVWQQQLYPLRHFLLRNLAEVLGEPLITDIDFRPMPPRRKPQRASTARPQDDSAAIGDPVMAMLYRQSKKRA
jgi:predicted nucleic acid-binding Zn ribbon protein